MTGHEGVALSVNQARAVTAQGLCRQRRWVEADVDGGGVELDKIWIGDHRAGYGCQRHGFAAKAVGIGCYIIEPAKAPRRQDHGIGKDRLDLAISLNQGPANPPADILDQSPNGGPLQNLNEGAGANRGDHAA